MPLWQATAALTIATAIAAPEPSPSRMPRSRRGVLPSRFNASPWARSAETCPRGNDRARLRRAPCSTAAAEETTKPSSTTGVRLDAGGEDRAGDGGDLTSAEAAPALRADRQDASLCSATAARTASALRFRPASSTPGAPSDPVLRLAAVERVIDRRRRRGVADAHLAERQQVRLGGQRLHAVGHRSGAGPLVHRRLLRDVAGRLLQRELVDLQRNIEGLADLVDRRAAGGEIRHHRLRHRRRERRDPLRHDAVIAGEDCDQQLIDMRPGGALPAGQEGRNLLEPPERAGRLGQLPLTLPRGRDGSLVRRRHFLEQRADIVEWAGRRHERLSANGNRDVPISQMRRGADHLELISPPAGENASPAVARATTASMAIAIRRSATEATPPTAAGPRRRPA